MLSGDDDDVSERLATAMQTANSSGRGVPDDFTTASGAHESDSSPANKPAKVAFSPFEQASSNKDVSTAA